MAQGGGKEESQEKTREEPTTATRFAVFVVAAHDEIIFAVKTNENRRKIREKLIFSHDNRKRAELRTSRMKLNAYAREMKTDEG